MQSDLNVIAKCCVQFIMFLCLRREKTRLEKLQQEQRMMEERNKQRKALLAKTIAEKYGHLLVT